MRICTVILAGLLFAPLAKLDAAELKLAAVFADHMVLQSAMPVPVWGWADADAQVTVEFAGQVKSAVTDAAGKWMVKLDQLNVNTEPQDLTVSLGSQAKRVVRDVLVGEVWLCSGQSNMGMSVSESANAEKEIATAAHPLIRLFTVNQNPSLSPQADVKGAWAVCAPQTVPSFSAAAYFFGRRIQSELRVPVGLIHSSVGGTPAEAWTRFDALQKLEGFGARGEKEVSEIIAQPETTKRFPSQREAWEEKHHVKPPSLAAVAEDWADPALGTSDWKEITLPAQWGQLGFKSGGVVSNGKYLREEEARLLPSLMGGLKTGGAVESEVILWQSYGLFALVIGIFATEWTLRKRYGLL